MDLREYLKINKITQDEFAKDIGISRAHLNQILNGKVDPFLSTVRKIEKATHGKVKAKDLPVRAT